MSLFGWAGEREDPVKYLSVLELHEAFLLAFAHVVLCTENTKPAQEHPAASSIVKVFLVRTEPSLFWRTESGRDKPSHP